jgi:hypothetical protein
MANEVPALAGEWEDHVRRHAYRKTLVMVVATQTHLERFDVALGSAHIALRREIGIYSAEKDRALTLLA